MNISISSSKYDIIESGSVIVPEDDYIEFSIDNLRFRFVFTSNHTNCESETLVLLELFRKMNLVVI